METTKVYIQKKRGHEIESRETHIPTDAAMLEVIQRFRGQTEPSEVEIDGFRVLYQPPEEILSWPASVFGEGDFFGPPELSGMTPAIYVIANDVWFASFTWEQGAAAPMKGRTSRGVTEGRPVLGQGDLFDRHPHEKGPSAPEAIPDADPELHEGARHRVDADRYERDPKARARCIGRYGATCFVCGFDFGKVYGSMAEGFIHVHHLRPLSHDRGDHQVDPVADLRPLCPNCHNFVHLTDPPLGMEEAKAMLAANRQT